MNRFGSADVCGCASSFIYFVTSTCFSILPFSLSYSFSFPISSFICRQYCMRSRLRLAIFLRVQRSACGIKQAAAAVKRLVFLCSMQSASIIFLRRFENHFVFWDKNQIICSRGNQLLASRTKENAVSLSHVRCGEDRAQRCCCWNYYTHPTSITQ
jgi:hypothetical protein